MEKEMLGSQDRNDQTPFLEHSCLEQLFVSKICSVFLTLLRNEDIYNVSITTRTWSTLQMH